MRPVVVLSAILVILMLSSAPYGGASPEHNEETTYGSTPGDPRVAADAGDCIALAAEVDGTDCAVMYGHFLNLRDDVPINTQRPPDWVEDLAAGYDEPVGVERREPFINEFGMWSTAGFVEYTEPGVRPLLHPEKGITRSVELDPDIPIVGYWYLSADYDEYGAVDGVPGHGPDAGVLPCLKVRMYLQTGRIPGEGDRLAEGSVTKTVMSAAAAGEGSNESLATTPCPESDAAPIVSPEAITEFKIPLEPLVDDLTIPRSEGFVVFVEWWQFDLADDPDRSEKVYMAQWNLRSGPDALGRLVLPIRTNVVIEDLRTIELGGKMYVQAVVNSPWGSYDVDPGSLSLSLLDADGDPVAIDHLGTPRIQFATDHTAHFKPLRATYEWDYRAEGLEPGNYTLVASARNWQHLGEATLSTQFDVRGKGEDQTIEMGGGKPKIVDKDSPAPSVTLVLALVGLLAGLGRISRRRTP